MRLASIQVGKPRILGIVGVRDGPDREWVSGIFKEPVAGRVRVGFTQIDGDGQADLTVHGGVDKAVLFYSADHYPAWRAELEAPDLAFGAFGENFTVAGFDETSICIADVWQSGELIIEVSQPREPCWKLARKHARNDLPQRVVQTGRGGWYARVLNEGSIQAGDTFELVSRPNPAWSIARLNDVIHGRLDDPVLLESLSQASGLTARWQRILETKLASA